MASLCCIKLDTAIDPCAGSGHILDYMFDILMQIYTDYGYTTSEAVRSIVENNLYGLDIDERAAQLAYFSVMMKARSYDRRFLTRKDEDDNPDIPQPHVYAIVESNDLNQLDIEYFTSNDPKLKKNFGVLVDELHDAKEYGSILNVSQVDFAVLYARMDEVRSDISMYKESTLKTILPLIQVAETLAQKYHVVVTNPPYMGSSSMGAKLGKYVKDNYPDSKSDLFSVFIEQCGAMTKNNYFQAMITQHSWMFLVGFEKLRNNILKKDILNMAHLGARAFEEIGGEVVQTTSFVIVKRSIEKYQGVYCRLVDPTTQRGKEELFLSGEKRFVSRQSNYPGIPGKLIAYWVSERIFDIFIQNKTLGEYLDARNGMSTTDNNRFLRMWFECSIDKIGFNCETATKAKNSRCKWFPYNKGGEYRKWYGNKVYVVNWGNDGAEMKACVAKHYGSYSKEIRSEDRYFQESITWSGVSTGIPSFRYSPAGSVFDSCGSSMFAEATNIFYAIALVNSKIASLILSISSPTLSFNAGSMEKIPYIYDTNYLDKVVNLARSNIEISKEDWDSFECSWDFSRHPLLCSENGLSDAYTLWEQKCVSRFNSLKGNEENLNQIFIDIYGLQDELTPEVEDKDVTVRLADKARDIRSFISYAVGCMFGRYSLDVDGLAYAGGEWDASKYSTYIPDKDGIIPICDDEYFEDDIANRFVDFVCAVYGKDTLEENLKFIADALGGKGAPRQVIRDYFMNDFYADHLKAYQKRPIYWLFDSGKKNGFKCLIYIHRYKPDTIARIRTDYVHEQQARYRTAIAGLENQIANAGAGERVKLNKQLKKLQDQADELHGYEEKIHHLADQFISIDLDDGVKHNYEIFKDVLAKIK